MATSNASWEKIFSDYEIAKHDFDSSVFRLTSDQIKQSVQDFKKTSEKEVRILCSQTKQEDVPEIMRDMGLFLLPVKNGVYVLLRGEGYVDIPDIDTAPIDYEPEIDWPLETLKSGSSEMQHIDHAFAASMIRNFTGDSSLHLTIRGRKWTVRFDFSVGDYDIEAESVQAEVDAGYEGKRQIILLEAKNAKTHNTIIRQLFYPYRHWSALVPEKAVRNVFFEKREDEYLFWEFEFADKNDYNSIELVRSAKYRLTDGAG